MDTRRPGCCAVRPLLSRQQACERSASRVSMAAARAHSLLRFLRHPLGAPRPPATAFSDTLGRAEAFLLARGVAATGGASWTSLEGVFGGYAARLSKNLQDLVQSGHPLMNTLNRYYLSPHGKHLRPLLVLLLARALAEGCPASPHADRVAGLQERLAQVTEMIHAASLLHDDVIDSAHSRRGQLSAAALFGNKASILSGDYLLAMASIELCKLDHLAVVQNMAQSIADLVQGELMQLDVPPLDGPPVPDLDDPIVGHTSPRFQYYLEKTYRKTASLLAHSCASAAILAGHPEPVQTHVHAFGKYFGIAFQLLDDKLDFEGDEKELGKTVGTDVKSGLLTAPLLYAYEAHPGPVAALLDSAADKTSPGHEKALLRLLQHVRDTDALAKTDALARRFIALANAQLSASLPESEALTLLVELTSNMSHRRN